MTRYKGRRSIKLIERDYPHIVELAVPENGFGNRVDAMHEWFRARGIQGLAGRGARRADQDYVSWCFADSETAAAFIREFGGVRRG